SPSRNICARRLSTATRTCAPTTISQSRIGTRPSRTLSFPHRHSRSAYHDSTASAALETRPNSTNQPSCIGAACGANTKPGSATEKQSVLVQPATSFLRDIMEDCDLLQIYSYDQSRICQPRMPEEPRR